MRSQVASQKAREQIEKEAAETEAAEAETKKPADVKKDNKTSTEDEPRFNTVWGSVTGDELLEHYPSIRDMVRDKRYFLTGYATQEVEFGGQKFNFRTLKKDEQRLATLLSEDAERHPVTGEHVAVPDEFLRWQMLLMVKRVGAEEWDDLQIPTTSSARRFKEASDKEIDKFANSPEVQRRLRIIGAWPEQLYDRLSFHCQSINLAYSIAIQKDLANP